MEQHMWLNDLVWMGNYVVPRWIGLSFLGAALALIIAVCFFSGWALVAFATWAIKS